MFIKALKVEFLDDVKFKLYFQDGKIFEYDLVRVFDKYPQLKDLRTDRNLFINGHLDPGGYGVIWNDRLDFSAMSVYVYGKFIGTFPISINQKVAMAIMEAREAKNLTQVELSKLSGIDQGDISKIEQGLGNPTIKKLQKIANGLNMELNIFFK